MEPDVLLAFLSYLSTFRPICTEANCGLVGFFLVLQAFRLVWGPETSIHHLSSSDPKMALSRLQMHDVLKEAL